MFSNTNQFGSSLGGGGLFGQQQQQQQPNQTGTPGGLFGSLGTGGGGLFGSTSGSSPQAGGTTGGGLFGQSTQPTGLGLLGTSSTQQQQPTGGGLFGSTTTQPTSAFGGTGGGLFGQSTSPTTTTTGGGGGGGLFGSTASQNQPFGSTTGGLFGSTANKGLFGTSTTTATPTTTPVSVTGTRDVKWRDEFNKETSGRIQAISYVPEINQLKSLEELRWEDYQLGLSSGKPTSTLGTFGQQTTGTTGLGGGLFGSSLSASSPTGGGLFGTSTTTQPTTTGGGLFGTSISPTGGGGGLFGQKPATTTGGLFGTQPTTTTGGLFGSTTGTGGGGGLFGSTTTRGGLFGSGTTGSGQQTGGGLFGSTTSPTAGQQGTGLFGSTSPTTTGGLFGATTQQPSTGGLFGTPTTGGGTAGGLFGSTQLGAAGTTGGLFGSGQPSTGTTGGGLFGNTTQQPTSTTGLFGNLSQPTAQGGLGTTGGGLFGTSTTTPTGGGLFGTTQPQQQQQTGTGLFGQTTQPSALGGGGLFSKPAGTTGATTGLGGGLGGSGGGGLFGTGGGLFGSTQTPAPGTQQDQSTSSFGQKPATPQPGLGLGGGGGLFGTSSLTGTSQAPAGGLFGTTTQPTPGQSLFGTQQQQPSAGTAGSLFGGGGLFGTQQQQQPSLLQQQQQQPLGTGLFGQSGVSLTPQQGAGALSQIQPVGIPSSNASYDPYGLNRLASLEQQYGLLGGASYLAAVPASAVLPNPFAFPTPGVILPTQFRRYRSATLAQIWRPLPEYAAESRRPVLPSSTPRRTSAFSQKFNKMRATLSGTRPHDDFPRSSGSLRDGATGVGRDNFSSYFVSSPGFGGEGSALSTVREGHARGESASPLTFKRGRHGVSGGGLRGSGDREGEYSDGRATSMPRDEGFLMSARRRPTTLGEARDALITPRQDNSSILRGGLGTMSASASPAKIRKAINDTSVRMTGRLDLSGGEGLSSLSDPAARERHDEVVLATRRKLTPRLLDETKGYTTKPSLEALASYTEARLSAVEDFTVVREGFGEITWPGLTDVRGLIIDEVVLIEDKTVEVYPPAFLEGTGKEAPEIGVGLNKQALVTLLNCKPTQDISASSGESQRNAYEVFVRKVRLYTGKIGAHFVSLSPEGVWKFRVDHFSRYAWIDKAGVASHNSDLDHLTRAKRRTSKTDKMRSVFESTARSVVQQAERRDEETREASLQGNLKKGGAVLVGSNLCASKFTLDWSAKTKAKTTPLNLSGGPQPRLSYIKKAVRDVTPDFQVSYIDALLRAILARVGPRLSAWPLQPEDASEIGRIQVEFLGELLNDPTLLTMEERSRRYLAHQLETWTLIACLFNAPTPGAGFSGRRGDVPGGSTAGASAGTEVLEREEEEGRGESEDEIMDLHGDSQAFTPRQGRVAGVLSAVVGGSASSTMQELFCKSALDSVRCSGAVGGRGSLFDRANSFPEVSEDSYEECFMRKQRLRLLDQWLAIANGRRIEDLLSSGEGTLSGAGDEKETLLMGETRLRLGRAFLHLTSNEVGKAAQELLGLSSKDQLLSQDKQRFVRLAMCLLSNGSCSSVSAPPLGREAQYRQLLHWQERRVYDVYPPDLLRFHHLLAGVTDRLVASAAPDWRCLMALLLWYPSLEASVLTPRPQQQPLQCHRQDPPTLGRGSIRRSVLEEEGDLCWSHDLLGSARPQAWGRNPALSSAKPRRSPFPRSSIEESSGWREQGGLTRREAQKSIVPCAALERALGYYQQKLLRVVATVRQSSSCSSSVVGDRCSQSTSSVGGESGLSEGGSCISSVSVFDEQSKVPLPTPPWLTSQSACLCNDVQYSLLRLFVGDPECSSDVLDPIASSPDPLDYLQPFLLLTVLGESLHTDANNNSSSRREPSSSYERSRDCNGTEDLISASSSSSVISPDSPDNMGTQLPPSLRLLIEAACHVQRMFTAQLEDLGLWHHVPAVLLQSRSCTRLSEEQTLAKCLEVLTRNLTTLTGDTTSSACHDSLVFLKEQVGIPSLILKHCLASTKQSKSSSGYEACDLWLSCAILSSNALEEKQTDEAEAKMETLLSSSLYSESIKTPLCQFMAKESTSSALLMTPGSYLCHALQSLVNCETLLTAIRTLCNVLLNNKQFLRNALVLTTTAPADPDSNTDAAEVWKPLSMSVLESLHESLSMQKRKKEQQEAGGCGSSRQSTSNSRLSSTLPPPPVSQTTCVMELMELAFNDSPFERRQQLDFDGSDMFRRTVPDLCSSLIGWSEKLLQNQVVEKSPALVLASFIVWIARLLKLHANINSTATALPPSSYDETWRDESSFLKNLAEHLFFIISQQLDDCQTNRRKNSSVIGILPHNLQLNSPLPGSLTDFSNPLFLAVLDIQRLITGCLQAMYAARQTQ